MRNYNIVIILFAILFFISCDHKNNSKHSENVQLAQRPTTPMNDVNLMHKLIDSAISKGDSKAYNTVASYYFIESREQDFFYYAFIMANKHKNAEAHYHVYMTLALSSPSGEKKTIMNLDEKSKNIAIYYLLKSHELGYDQAKYQIEEIFGKNAVVPKSSTYLQKFCAE